MSKLIKVTPEIEAKCREEFEKAIKDIKMSDGKFSFSVSFANEKRNAVIYYSSVAWEKQNAILREFDKEVAWHGVARRGDDPEKDEYYIDDIMVYPQSVTATTVEMDTEEYAVWLMDNYEDERFESIYMQAHSHVNMGVTPSSVDIGHQEEILAMLDDDSFYIFMIWNKSLSVNAKIYDMRKNILFEDKDIIVKVDGFDYLNEFIAEAKDMVKNKTYAYNKSAQNAPAPVNKREEWHQADIKPFNPVATKGKSSGKKAKRSFKDAYDDDDYYEYLKAMYGEEIMSPFYYRD